MSRQEKHKRLVAEAVFKANQANKERRKKGRK